MITRLDELRVVLVRTTHPGNIGGVARAMRNMALSDLALVSPGIFPDEAADARAAGAENLLRSARVCETLGEAIADRDLVIGTSARSRSLPWPSLTPRELARLLVFDEPRSRPAILFGPERNGLSNAEVDRCQYLLAIPVEPEFPSLNLACAVQVIAYEIRLAWLEAQHAEAPPSMAIEATAAEQASSVELAHLFAHLEQVLVEVAFIRSRPAERLLRRIIRLLQRARLTQEEVNILRGVLTAVQRAVARARAGNT